MGEGQILGVHHEEFKTPNLAVRFYLRDPNRVIVVFASAGARRVDGFSEEFAGTLNPTGASIIFVTDRWARWFNHDETDSMLGRVAGIVRGFKHAGAMGESLGGSGALLFTNFAENISRVLAITPQYSVAEPFVRFDDRYIYESKKITRFYYGTFDKTRDPEKCVLLYGNTTWRDHLHRAMFEAAGYAIATVDNAPHELSQYLKVTPNRNNLAALLGHFSDFEKPFSKAALREISSIEWTDIALRERHSFAAHMRERVEFSRYQRDKVEIPATRGRLISAGKPATQSSVWEGCEGRSKEEDAARAVSGQITGGFAFHTVTEDRPWWKLDLLERQPISEIRLFNRLHSQDIARRAYRLDLLVSDDDENWRTVFTKDDNRYFGGADGRPLISMFSPAVEARWVKVMLRTREPLHLDQVQIFGP